MRLSSISIQNFRSIAQAKIALSPFVCVVGHNNAGKSSFLVALSLFRSGTSLKASDFYDKECEIVFEVVLEGVTDSSVWS